MAFKDDQDRQTVRDMIIAGQGMAEIMALNICNQADVYCMRHELKKQGVKVKTPAKVTKESIEDSRKVRPASKLDVKPLRANSELLTILIEEQDRLRERLARIDAVVAIYDTDIPLTIGHKKR